MRIDKPRHVIKIIALLTACCILHNFLLDEIRVPREWYNYIAERLLNEDDPEVLIDAQIENEATNEPSDTRRTQIFHFILEAYHRSNR